MTQLKPLTAELHKIAIDELGEVPSRVMEDLQALKTWIEHQPHLKARTDDQFLIQFLRGCKFSLERAKEKIDHFYALKTKYPELFQTLDVNEIKFRELNNVGSMITLPVPLNDNGPRIMVYRFNYPCQIYSVSDVLRLFNAMHEIFLNSDPYACINGIIYLLDFGDASANHFLQFTPSVLKRLFRFMEKSLPLRIKGFCYINVSGAGEQFFKILLPCLSEKLRSRISICGHDHTNLYQRIPLKYLPQEYGGENGSLEQLALDYNKVWDEHREYFRQNAKYGTLEHLRTGKPLDLDGVFGVDGSFRKIDVD